MALQVSGKVALITGAGSGIGLAFANLLVSKSCKVLIVDLRLTAEAEKFVQENKGEVSFQKSDVTDWKQLREAFEAAIFQYGSLDIVCPNAGISEPLYSSFWNWKHGEDTEESNSYKTIETNLTHPMRATQLAIDSFKRQAHGHGVVLIVSSIAAQGAFLPAPMYAASKAGISSFCRSLAPLEQAANIRVVGVSPAVVKTPIWTPEKMAMFDETRDEWIMPEEVAGAMLDCVQKEEYVGGTIVEVGLGSRRLIELFGDPGPPIGTRGYAMSKIMDVVYGTFAMIESQFGK